MKRKKVYKHHLDAMKSLPKGEEMVYFDRWKGYVVLAIIVLISFIAYLPVFHNGFLAWDDNAYIKNNVLIHSLDLKEIFSHNVMGNWHPFTILTLALEYQFFGLNATGYHSVNLLLHLLNVILVFYAVSLLSDKAVVALVASLLFGIHPLHVESVAWAAELKDLLYTFFFLASFICYLKYLELRIKELKNMKSRTSFHSFILSFFHLKSTSTHQHINTSTHYYYLALLLFTFSLLSKAMAASLPLVLILTDYFKGRKINVKTLLEKVPFFLLAIVVGIVAVMAQKSSGSTLFTTMFTFPQRIVFAFYGFVNYLIKLLFPLNLSAFYAYPAKVVPIRYYAYILSFLVIAAGVFYSLRFSKKILFGMGFFTVTVLLVLQLFPVGKAIMAERYSYIPSIGIFYLAGEGFMLLWSKKIKLAAIVLLSFCVVLFSVKTYARCGVWKNDMTLWNNVIDYDNTIGEAYINRGLAFFNEKRNDEAISDFNKAIELEPESADACFNRGIFFVNVKRIEDAINDFNSAIKLKPGYAEVYYNRALVEFYAGNKDAACKDLKQAVSLGYRLVEDALSGICK